MDEVYIDMRKQNRWISKYFNADFVSIDNLLACIEDLDARIEQLENQLSETKEEEYEDWKWQKADELYEKQKLNELTGE